MFAVQLKTERIERLKSAIIIYLSNTGNTERVAFAIRDGLERAGLNVMVKKPQEADEENFYGYDLVCAGSPSIEWQPAKPIADLLRAKLNLPEPRKNQALCPQSREQERAGFLHLF